MTRITRVEVITNNGREYIHWEDDNDITYMLQDSNRTLKVFVGKAPPEQPMTEEENEKYFEEAKQIVEKHFAKKKMTEAEQLKAEIKVLEKKLSFLEELKKTKSPAEEAFKDWWGEYPETENRACGGPRWEGFQAGYNAACEEKVSQEPEKEQKWNVVRESVKWCEENPDKDPLDWLKPQTPKQVENGLKEAFREAVKQGVVSSADKPKDDFIDEMVAELKGQTLTDIIWNWWTSVFTSNEEWDAENAIEHLVDLIETFLPKEQSANSQNAYVESAVEGFNDCLNKIKGKLR